MQQLRQQKLQPGQKPELPEALQPQTQAAPPPGLIVSGANVVQPGANWATIGGGGQNTTMVPYGTVGGGFESKVKT